MIQVKDLFFTYPGNTEPTIKNVNVTIPTGEIFGFLGPSGAGKSTLQKILIGVLKGYQGSVSVLHQDVNKATTDFYNTLGVAFETPNFYQKFTAKENLQFFQSFYEKEGESIEKLMEKVGLGDVLETRVSDFSKGMKMRLNVVRAFLHDPELIFLDEPTSGLDPLNVQKVRELIVQMKEAGKTIILNTHNMNVAEILCDRVAFIVDGEVKLIDSPDHLKNSYSQKEITVVFKEKGIEKQASFEMKHLGTQLEFQKILQQDQLVRINTNEKTLEDIFIEVTGRKLQ
ncbi:ABC transporter ATP-binding protein [Evansella tamaricis]|uniref:ABC transporter ATP-binding protein n=1 Tax=Evansella tamaricis TaxID=2069301 RepID=A0ABS6JR60_9BACI|nr:ABC transporter ATP-binding protein [Evansella tamaricis]MBU9714788.1 ABC transporter ATP-binding protein [Evansella tamaricis]